MSDPNNYETEYMLKDSIGFEYIVDSCAYCKYFIDNKECCTLHDMKVRKDSKCDFYNTCFIGGNEHYV